ncbi:MAG: aminotransferase class V-fold PLP-dependent enzyme [Acidobacteria bacterium]|nr:aminotransferase class V-fold PLP-dependent enzyme [Acidobacteriota bacterium]
MGFDNLATAFAAEFPVRDHLIYLNHAAVAPLPASVAQAMSGFSREASLYGSRHYDRWMRLYEDLRESAARLIGASPREIAITKNTSEGVSMVAQGIDWQPGDRVVAFREEFPSNFYPWRRLEDRGVQVEWLSIHDPLERIESAVRGARLLAISFVNYLSGHRVDLEAIGALCSAAGCFFFVDAIQGLGAFPLDVERARIDALAADGHKWLLGPEGCAILYVRRERQSEIFPVEFGWTTPAGHQDYASRDERLRDDAGRYECGTLNTIGCFGLKAALDLILAADVERIGLRVLSLADQLAEGAVGAGYQLMLPRDGASSSGILCVRHPDADSGQVVRFLRENNVMAAPRQGWIRLSPHFYLDESDIARAVGFLRAALKG